MQSNNEMAVLAASSANNPSSRKTKM